MRGKKILTWLPLFAFLSFSIYKSIHAPVHDFANYYLGSYFFSKGGFTPSLYDPLFFNQKAAAEGFTNLWISYAPNPPFTSLLFLPFVLVELTIAKLIFNLLSVFLFLAAWTRLCKHLAVPVLHAATLSLVIAVPVYNNIAFGQAYFLLFFLLAEGYLAIEKNYRLRGALLWAIAILFKITPAILFVYLLFKKQYKAFGFLVAACAALFVLSIALNGMEVWKFYLTTILPKASQGEVTSAAFTINYQSAHMFFKYLLLSDSVDNAHPLLNSKTTFLLVLLIFKIGTVVLAAFYTRSEKNRYTCWAIWIPVSFLISPYGSTYSYILLLIPLLAFCQTKYFPHAVVLCFILANIPLKFLFEVPLLLQFPRLYLLILLFILLLVQTKLEWNMKIAMTIACIFTVSELPNLLQRNDASIYVFNGETPQLIFDYTLEDGYLAYTYWEYTKTLKEKTDLPASKLSADNVEIIDNQIYYNGISLTSSRDKKIKASILNDTTILYLSDKDRGYGFYTFRKLRVP